MREAFVHKDFKPATLAVIEAANQIIGQYQRQGFVLTLRQLYYQFVARSLMRNHIRNYDRLQSIVSDARLAGLIDWDTIEDRTRNVRCVQTWGSVKELLSSLKYREDLWQTQKARPEVWVEKDALLGVIERACNRYRVPYFACRGYTSQSELYAAGKRFQTFLAEGLKPIIIHLGDHDPSGIDMTRDNKARISMFAGAKIPVWRIALNADQIRQYRPPPNPAKETDSRHRAYREKFGNSSWELDALEPTVIDALLIQSLERLIDDRDAWMKRAERERFRQSLITRCAKNWGAVAKFLKGGSDAV